jgi:hypothetical protein
VLAIAVWAAAVSPAVAQRLPFERAIDVMPGATLDVTTIRGRIDVTTHEARQIRVDGTVTVRVSAGFTGSGDPLVLARRVADRPPIEVAGNVVRLRAPANDDELRALTVAYQVRVPRDTTIIIGTDSGAVTVDGVSAESPSPRSRRPSPSAASRQDRGEDGLRRRASRSAAGGLRVVTQSSSSRCALAVRLTALEQLGIRARVVRGGRFRRC